VNAATFELTVLEPAQDAPVAVVRGEVDITNAAELERALADLAADGLVVDLSDAGYFDSAGFAVLDRLLGEGALAVVVAPGSVVRTAMTLMNMPFHDTVDAARAALKPG
jgi:anti-sigma B factor antagonist